MGSTFIPSRCALVDVVGTNVLVRGNMPLVAPDMRYALPEIRDASGVEDLLSRTLVEVPIVDNVGERRQFEALLGAFSVDPSSLPSSDWPWWLHGVDGNALRGSEVRAGGLSARGHVMWRPFEGLLDGEDPREYLGSPGWDFGGFVDRVISLLRTLDNAAVYVHCQLGADRTGAFHAGYLMRAVGMSCGDAVRKASEATSAGSPNADYLRLARAYGASLGR